MSHAKLNRSIGIPLKYANRHGLITGQTGTGKTVTLQTLAESFSFQGVPVFIADVKGDIAALSRSCPTTFLDVFGQAGKPLTTSIIAMGPDLLSRALELTDTQAGTLEIAFAVARDTAFPLDTIRDLRNILNQISGNGAIQANYGHVSPASIGVILRSLLRLQTQGGDRFFSTNRFDVADLLSASGDKGLVSILKADRLLQSPRVYSAFLLWLLSDLYNRLPEVGDIDRLRLVFFFDEAHLLFQDCPQALLRRIEQTVRLIRSKGVGVYFVSQSPNDIPAMVREQLAHRVEHSRALLVGTANVTTMDASGKPLSPRLVQIDLPRCPLGALSEAETRANMPAPQASPSIAPRAFAGTVSAFEAAFMALCLIALAGVCYGLFWAWQSGAAGKVAAAFIGIALAGVLKR